MKLTLGAIAKKLKNKAVADTNLLKKGLSSLKKDIDTGLAVDRMARKNLGSNIQANVGNTVNNLKENLSGAYSGLGLKNAVEDAGDALVSTRRAIKKGVSTLPTPMLSIPNSLVEKGAKDLAATRRTLGRIKEAEKAISGTVGKGLNNAALGGIEAINRLEAKAIASAPKNREFLKQGYKITEKGTNGLANSFERLKKATLKSMQKKGATTDSYSQIKQMFDDMDY